MYQLRNKTILMLMIAIHTSTETNSTDQYVECKSELNKELKLKNDTIIGRYVITWCPKDLKPVNKSSLQWLLTVYVGINNCTEIESRSRPILQHSIFQEYYKFPHEDCSHYCLSTTLDLMYTACYLIENRFGGIESSMVQYIKNNYTKEHYYNYTVSHTPNDPTYHTPYLDFELFSQKQVPLSDFEVEIKNVHENITDLKYVYPSSDPKDSKFNCKRLSTFSVRCVLSEALKKTWEVTLTHEAAWRNANENVLYKNLTNSHIVTFSYVGDSPPAVRGGVPWGAGVAVVGATVVAVSGALLYRTLKTRTLTMQHFKQQRSESGSERPLYPPSPSPSLNPSLPPSPPPSVVLLYERDHPEFNTAMEALATYIREQGLNVIDIHSPAAIAEMQLCGTVSSWVSRGVQQPHCYLLIVQSTAATYTLPHDLTKRRILRNTGPGSTALLEYITALRLQTDFPTTRYLVAQVDVPGIILPDIVPFLNPLVRVHLPAGLEALLTDLPIQTDHDLLTQVTPHLTNYVEIAQRNHNYLEEYFMD